MSVSGCSMVWLDGLSVLVGWCGCLFVEVTVSLS